MRLRPALVTHTWCLARQSDSVSARAGAQESQITATTPSTRATSRRMSQPPFPVRFTPYALRIAAPITLYRTPRHDHDPAGHPAGLVSLGRSAGPVRV